MRIDLLEATNEPFILLPGEKAEIIHEAGAPPVLSIWRHTGLKRLIVVARAPYALGEWWLATCSLLMATLLNFAIGMWNFAEPNAFSKGLGVISLAATTLCLRTFQRYTIPFFWNLYRPRR